MIIIRQKEFTHVKLYKEWTKTKDPETAYKWSLEYNKAYDKYGNLLEEPDPEIVESVWEYHKMKNPGEYKTMKEWNKAVNSYWNNKNYKISKETVNQIRKTSKGTGAEEITDKIINKSKKNELSKLGKETDKKIRKAVSGTGAEEKVNKILDKSTKEMKEKQFSKQDREVVPQDIVEKVKNGGGVIQKDHKGSWRIISMKTKTNKSGKPEFWSGHYDSKKDAKAALGNYWKNKH
jgi:hypothetical protein